RDHVPVGGSKGGQRSIDFCEMFPQPFVVLLRVQWHGSLRLTRIRLQLAVYFWLHRGKCALKGGKLASHKRAWKNRFYDKILLVISWDRILGASPKGHLVCCMVILTSFG